MRQVKKTVYKFDELNGAAKNRAVEDIKQSENYMDWDWSYGEIDDFKRRIDREYGIEIDDVSLSGFYCQGDGFSFTGSIPNVSFLLDYFEITFEHSWLYDIFCNSVMFTIKRGTGQYYHKNSVYADYEWNDDLAGYPTLHNYIEEKADEYLAALEELKNQLCCEEYDELQNIYESYFEYDNVVEYIQDNEFEYEEDGILYHV